MSRIEKSTVARSVPFDNTSNGFVSDEVQGAIEEIGASASPGFSFGRSGTSNAGTYLQVDSVPSNQAGRIVPLTSAYISDIFISCQTVATFSVEIQRRVGNTFTTIYTQSVTASRKLTASITGVPVGLGDEICCRVGSGSASNLVVGIIVRGGT
jgi:hypothetical protein